MTEHKITEIRSPLNVVVRCSCGWCRTVTRIQNAYARAAQVRAAINQHRVNCCLCSCGHSWGQHIKMANGAYACDRYGCGCKDVIVPS